MDVKILLSVMILAVLLTACGPAQQQTQQAAPEQTAPQQTEPIQTQPQEQPTQTEQKPAETKETPSKNVVVEDNQAYNIAYDEVGMITDVSCNYEKGTVNLHFKNVADYTLNMYQGEVPTPPSALKFSLNGRQFNSAKTDLKLNCGKNEFAPGEEADCYGENVMYRGGAAFNQKGNNRLLGQIVGLSDLTTFQCGTIE